MRPNPPTIIQPLSPDFETPHFRQALSRFATGQGDRFAQTDYTLDQAGLPILKCALAWFEFHNRSRYEEGDHVIFVGEVERCGFAEEGQSLVFQQGQFGTTTALP